MTTRKLERTEWDGFCTIASSTLLGKRTEIEIASLDIGAQIGVTHLPLLGLTYDPKSDIFEIALEGGEHLVHSPRELYVDEEFAGIVSLEIVDASGARQIVLLHDPLMLPPPSAH